MEVVAVHDGLGVTALEEPLVARLTSSGAQLRAGSVAAGDRGLLA